MSAPDSELLRRFAAGDHDAFSALVRRHIDLVYASALRQVRGDAHRAKDITQEVFISLARKAATLARHPTLIAWLHTSARYAAVNAIRAEQRRARREEHSLAMHENDASDGPDATRIAAVLDDTMHELNERDRTAVLLRFFRQASFAAIGEQIGTTENGAQKRVDRALARLRAGLARRGITSTGAALSAALASQAAVVAPEYLASAVTNTAIGSLALGGGAASAWTIFLMTKLKIATLTAVLLAGTAAIVIQHQHNAQLREENLRLRNEQTARAQRSSQTAAPAPISPTSAAALSASAKAAPPGTAPADLIPIASLQNAGNASPDATFESIFWAVTHHDVETLGKLLVLSARGKSRADAAFQKVPAPVINGTHITTPEEMIGFLFTAKMGELSAMQVRGTTEKSPDEVSVAGTIQHADGKTDKISLDFHHSSDGWQWQIADKMVLYAADEWEHAMQSRAAAKPTQ